MGSPNTESFLRWVWDANRNHPVGENAALTFGRDGNLVLTDYDGTLAWQTNTANKGVVGIRLFNNGNLVLYNAKGQFVWQSFDYPTDTLLVGQSLRPTGPNKLIARRSNLDASDGPYSMVLQGEKLDFYLQSKNSQYPLKYYSNEELSGSPLSQVFLNCTPQTTKHFAYEVRLELFVNTSFTHSYVLAKLNYNSSFSILRLESDGNLKVYTFYDKVDSMSWDVPYSLFGGRFSLCNLPSKCGSLGLCEEEQCVACPTQEGLLGWSSDCKPPDLPPCDVNGSNIDYYKVEDVENFSSFLAYGEGNATIGECEAMCSKDCGCLGFFFWEDLQSCFLAPELMTLTKAYNAAHVGYIKKAKSTSD
ncbi:hypothetical protein Sjap_000502 [Stephania japonica]|uniref:Bulb-type lectin domain-containing protein n=1 Tax=Stephania japonica TaxID=461633 RepID=A0AAP0PQT2_9MAGN